MCVEWLRANGHPTPAPSPRRDVALRELGIDAIGEVRLVPGPADAHRSEVSLKHLEVIQRVLRVFPGTRLAGLWMPWPDSKQPKEEHE